MTSPEEALERAHAQHAAAIYNLRTSFQYRLGDALVRAVSSRQGAISAPRELARLAREALRHRRGERVMPEPWASPPRRSVAVASILDEFSHTCFAPEFRLNPLEPGTAVPSESRLLLAETAWRGNGGAWSHSFSQPHSAAAERLDAMLSSARGQAIPTVLWNKEDPANFEVFIESARKFDWVFTTDSDLLDLYRDRLGHDRVNALTFAAQPAIHNPIGSTLATTDRIAFFGAWRGEKYPDRGRDLEVLLHAAADARVLDIYDRHADEADASLHFPHRWAEHVRGSLPYAEVNHAYRRQAAVLNVNSVVESPTMVARRVFEVLASRTPVISGPSRSLEPLFGDTVLVASNEKEATAHVERIVHDVDFRERHAHRGYRHVHTNHTYDKRADELFSTIGLDVPEIPNDPVAVVCVSNRPHHLNQVLASFERQQGAAKKLIFVANSRDFSMDEVSTRVTQLGGLSLQVDDEATLGECINEALSHTDARFFAKFDDDDYYGPHHVHDLVLAHRYAGAAVVGRRSYYVTIEDEPNTVHLRNPGHEFAYVEYVAGGSFMADRERTNNIRFEAVRQGTDTRYMRAVRSSGEQIFSASRFNYLFHRRRDLTTHTWQVDRDQLLAGSESSHCDDAEEYVTV